MNSSQRQSMILFWWGESHEYHYKPISSAFYLLVCLRVFNSLVQLSLPGTFQTLGTAFPKFSTKMELYLEDGFDHDGWEFWKLKVQYIEKVQVGIDKVFLPFPKLWLFLIVDGNSLIKHIWKLNSTVVQIGQYGKSHLMETKMDMNLQLYQEEHSIKEQGDIKFIPIIIHHGLGWKYKRTLLLSVYNVNGILYL